MAADPLTLLRDQVEDAIADPGLEPVERVAKLRDLRERISDLLGVADSYLGSVGRLREAQASRGARDVLWVRRQADLREALERDGVEIEEAWGLPTHDELDRLREEGLLEEAATLMRPTLAGLPRAPFVEAKHPRGRGGKFAHGDFFQHHDGAVVASADRLRPTKTPGDAEMARAAANTDKARRGLVAKRKPLDVRENGDGTLSIIDGNATFHTLKDKLTHFPVTVGEGDSEDAVLDRVAAEIQANAAAAEPHVTPVLKAVTSELGGSLEGLEHKLKSTESIKSKIRRKQEKYPGMTHDQAGLKILDAVRYTVSFPPTTYTQGIERTLAALKQQGFEPHELENFWGLGDDYDGYHAVMSGPNDVKIELQFHTPESLTVKSSNHPLYEQFRDSKDSGEREQLWSQMVANSAAVPPPVGVEALTKARPSPSAEVRTRRGEGSYASPATAPGQTAAHGVS